MRKTLLLVLSALSLLATTLVGAASQAAPTPYPVVWAVGDLCDAGGRCADVADLIAADSQTDAVLLAGDLAYNDGSRSDFARFHTLFGSKTFADGVTLKARSLVVPGNHEYRDGAVTSPCPYYFVYAGAAKAGSCTGTLAYGDQPWKTRLYPAGASAGTPGAWRILTLNSNYAAEPASAACNAWCSAGGTSTKYSFGLTAAQASSQRSWLASQCRTADANDQGAIVVVHHPALTDGSYRPGTRLGRDLFSVAAANGCEMVMVGHDHLYERFSPRNATGAPSATGTTQFLVGTGGHSPNAAAVNTAVKQWVGAGALRLVLTPTAAEFQFRSVAGAVVDQGTVPLN